MTYTVFLADEAATLAWGKQWASIIAPPLVVYLLGDLGAGKTTFTRGLLHAMGHQGAVKSPTYAIVESYDLGVKQVHHFDLYRFSTPEEWEDAGLDDLINHQAVCLIEWPNLGGDYVPQADLSFQFVHAESGRQCHVQALSPAGEECVRQWQN